jgi:hypothetical protein
MVNFLVGETTIVLENVVVGSTRSGGNLLEDRLKRHRW